MEGRNSKHNKLFVLIFSNIVTRTVAFSQDSVSTLKTFIFTLTHKAIFELTNVNHSVIIHNNIRVSGRYTF